MFTMLRRFLASVVLLLFAAFAGFGQQPVIPLYDGPAPGSENWTWNEAQNDSNAWHTAAVYNVSKPTLTVFQPEAAKANGTAVVIAPGGGFHALSINSEGFDVARWLVQKGVTCFVLKYRVAHSLTTDPVAEMSAKWGKKEFNEENAAVIPLCIADGRAAIAWVRSHARQYGVYSDRIGIMGFSAGGTVAASAMFGYNEANRPNFVAPVYAFLPPMMIGKIAADLPPVFIVAATDDGLGLAPHSADLYKRLLENKKDVELHMYARGNHGFGMRRQNLPTDQWIERFGDWMGVQGLLKRKAVDPAFAAFESHDFAFGNDHLLPYRILYPANYDKTKKYPLVLFLHGAGERGNDNEKQLHWGGKMFLNEENRVNFPAIVVFPQCPEESYWGNVIVQRDTFPLTLQFDYAALPTWPLLAAVDLAKKISREEAVDPGRIYITGLSMGGMGTFEAIYRFPDLFAAAMPICGGGDVPRYDQRVKKTPFWVFHGDADQVVDVNLSRNMVSKLKSLGATVKYTEYPGVNHNSWENAFKEPDFLKWMFTQKRKTRK